jgi:hypothetical protein
VQYSDIFVVQKSEGMIETVGHAEYLIVLITNFVDDPLEITFNIHVYVQLYTHFIKDD